MKFNRLNDFIRERFAVIFIKSPANIEMNFEFIFCTFKMLIKYIQTELPDSFCGTLLCTTSMTPHEGKCVVLDSIVEIALVFSWGHLSLNNLPSFPKKSSSNIRKVSCLYSALYL